MSIRYAITENDTKGFQNAMKAEITEGPIKHFERELAKIRTGRAHPSMVEDLPVICYDQNPMPLKALAVIAAPDVRLITIEPWDKSVIGDIEKAVFSSDLGLTPVNDGITIRLQLPMMSSARREDLAKSLTKKMNECKDGIKQVRKEFNNLMRDAKKNKTISEDFFNRLEDLLQKVTDDYVKQVDTMGDKKAQEIRLA